MSQRNVRTMGYQFYTFSLIITYLIGTSYGTLYEGSACKRHDGIPGVCKAVENCKWVKRNHIKPNLLQRCSFDHDTLFVCCGDEMPQESATNGDCDIFVFDVDVRDWCNTNGISQSTSTEGISNNEIGLKASDHCKQLQKEKPLNLAFDIYDGEEVPPGDYPHMTAIGYPSEEIGVEYEFRCGGTLIIADYVMTAAHCVAPDGPIPAIVRLGTIDLLAPDDKRNGEVQNIKVTKIMRHPEYKYSQLFHDVALLKLEKPADISQRFVYPACLNVKTDFPGANAVVQVIGWGETEYNDSKLKILLKTNLTVVNYEDCKTRYEELKVRGLRGGLRTSQICAWDKNFIKDACEGDSGGPLHAKLDRIDYVVGIVSFGVGCASKDPGVYTNVAYYIEWIESVVWPS